VKALLMRISVMVVLVLLRACPTQENEGDGPLEGVSSSKKCGGGDGSLENIFSLK
jgi:hypothetical protein